MSEEQVGYNEVAEKDALLINMDVDLIPEEEPFEDGEKLLTVKKIEVVASKKVPNYSYIKVQLVVENDPYTGLIFDTINPPGSHMTPTGQRLSRDTYMRWMEILSIPQAPNGAWLIQTAVGRSFYGICKTDISEEYGRQIRVKQLLRAV